MFTITFFRKVEIPVIVFLFVFGIALTAWAATYYVDATNGNDTNNGLSEATPWKTIAKVNGSKFLPGDQILFKRGEGGSKVKPLFFS
jgi:hypothetical protein